MTWRWRLYMAAAVFGAASGVMVGLLSPWRTAGFFNVRLHFQPPAGISSATLTCGWHRVCVYPFPDGPGLDWVAADYSGYGVYFRYWGVTPSSQTLPVAITSNTYNTDRFGCSHIRARIIDAWFSPGTGRGTMVYTHAGNLTSLGFIVYGKDGFGHFGEARIGTMVSEPITCPWTGYHVHEWHEPEQGASWVENRGRWPRAPWYDRCPNVQDLFGCWTRWVTW